MTDAAVLGPDGRLVPEARDELAAACELAGLPAPADDRWALELFHRPWDTLVREDAPGIQTLPLPDGPRAGDLVFSGPEQEIDLYDTGGYDGTRYDALPAHEVEEHFLQRHVLRRVEPWNRRNGSVA
jgi:hypothetical protein